MKLCTDFRYMYSNMVNIFFTDLDPIVLVLIEIYDYDILCKCKKH